MKVYSVSEGRKQLGEIVNHVVYAKEVIALGKHGRADVLIIPFTHTGEFPMAELNAQGGSFDWLEEEPELYSAKDIKHHD